MTATTRRSILAGSAAAALAGGSIINASASATASDGGDANELRRSPAAQLARVEQMIDALRNSAVSASWKLDEADASRVLRFFQAALDRPATHENDPGYGDDWLFVINFVSEHGQSLDWLLDGNARKFVVLAAQLSAAVAQKSDPIFAAIARYQQAEKLSTKTYRAFDEAAFFRGDKTGLTELRAASKKWSDEFIAARAALASTAPTTLAGMIALFEMLQTYAEAGGDMVFDGSEELAAHFASAVQALRPFVA